MAFGDDDLDAIFSADDPFAVLATFDINGTPLDVYGEFTDATKAVSMFSGQIESNDASITCRSDQIGDVKNDMTVEIDNVTYTVKDKQKLGTGTTLVILKT
jgi:hypothetical protein